MARDDQAELTAFIEKVGLFGVESGMQRSLARVMGLLLVCEPAHQSAEQIATKLQLSTGAVSNAVNVLQQAMLVKRVTFPNERKYYYEFDPQGWKHSLVARLKTVPHGIVLAEEGLEFSHNNQRLEKMRDFYIALNAEVEALMKRLDDIQ
jgi:DNA-binding transcriptional regulator GbsR (MarR family)